ncbi:MAG: 1,4-dihydroxy-2-naphthoate octaprenyltransferase [Paludibacteraceae bacterium]|nr:1,4-dihydroxy-2-naphthoate octaprenyltransferase [Paludibacteraceae bacterium]
MNPYIQSLRLRTLPLSVSGIILGSGIALGGEWSAVSAQQWWVFGLAIATTLSLQILSNLCNELGDAQKGTDADQKERAAYGLQTGKITVGQMKGMIALFIVLCLAFGGALIYSAFGSFACTQSLLFIGLGLLAVMGAIKYTLGKHSYGYIGLGDLGVFVFFGLLSTMGSYYLLTQQITWEIAWYGIAVGLPCVGVLNLNNIRDMDNDRKHGKRTFASLLGPVGSRVYHTLLLVGCLTIFAVYGHWWALCIIPVWAWHLWYLWTHSDKLDKQMPVLMFTTLIVVILALVG